MSFVRRRLFNDCRAWGEPHDFSIVADGLGKIALANDRLVPKRIDHKVTSLLSSESRKHGLNSLFQSIASLLMSERNTQRIGSLMTTSEYYRLGDPGQHLTEHVRQTSRPSPTLDSSLAIMTLHNVDCQQSATLLLPPKSQGQHTTHHPHTLGSDALRAGLA